MTTAATESRSSRTGWRELPPLARRQFIGIALSAVGSGLSIPFLFVYLTVVRDLPTTAIGLVLAWMGVVSLGVSPLVGTLIDRFGPRLVLAAGLAGEAAGMALVATIHNLRDAWLVATLVAVMGCAIWPASSALLTRLVPEQGRQRAFGLQFMLLNAGLGLGGLVASTLVDLDRPVTFERLYLIDAVSYLGYIVVLLLMPRSAGLYQPEPDADTGPQPGWRVVLADRTLLKVVGVATLLLICSYAQIESGFTAYAVQQAEVPARAIGWAFGANTAVIVVGQLVTLRLLEGRRRSRALGFCGLIWGCAWAVVALSGLAVPGWLAILCVVVGLAVFGAAETIWAPVMPAIVNDLADERVRGRYNALSTMTWTVAGIAGPAMAGILLGAGLATAWVTVCVGGCLLSAVAMARLGRHLTPEQNGVGRPAPQPVAVAEDLPTPRPVSTAEDLPTPIGSRKQR